VEEVVLLSHCAATNTNEWPGRMLYARYTTSSHCARAPAAQSRASATHRKDHPLLGWFAAAFGWIHSDTQADVVLR